MIDFPSATTGQIFSAAGASWRWDGTKWVAYGTGSSNDVGRNLVHNPLMAIGQRGNGAWTTNGAWTADRWLLSLTLDAASVGRGAATDTNRAQVGDEAVNWFLVNTFTGNAGASAFNRIVQHIEDVHRLGGKTVTVSLWAASGSGTPKLGISVGQAFGTGGSPSASVGVAGQSVTLSTTYTRYSATFALPSVSGKTLGTNGDDYTEVSLWYSSGTTNATGAGSPGVQTATIGIWGVQVEIGSTATPLEKPDPRDDLQRCQRFFIAGVPANGRFTATAVTPAATPVYWPPMRAVPTATQLAAGSSVNAQGGTVVSQTAAGGYFDYASLGAGDCYILGRTFTLSADL